MSGKKISTDFYLEPKAEIIAPRLLGKTLCVQNSNGISKGKIVEVEAYCGDREKACHAYFGKTKRNEAMFLRGGKAYVYLCYGIHSLFNVVTGPENKPCGALVRAVEPLGTPKDIEKMLKRRNRERLTPELTNGPGKLSQALGIGLKHNKHSLSGKDIWLEDGPSVENDSILAGPRVGVDYAGEDKYLPWRFALNSRFTGHGKLLRSWRS